MTIRQAKITIVLEGFTEDQIKYFTGTRKEVETEANDLLETAITNYIEEHDIRDKQTQETIFQSAYWMIDWNDDVIYMFAVLEEESNEPVVGIFGTRAEAEEAILTECEDWVYEVMMTNDPYEVIGFDEWDWELDSRTLLLDAGKAYSIQRVPVFGI